MFNCEHERLASVEAMDELILVRQRSEEFALARAHDALFKFRPR